MKLNLHSKVIIFAFFLLISHCSLAQNIYWVGGSGLTADFSHWSNTSGGPTCTCTPTASRNIIFDANSFPTTGAVVTLNSSLVCGSIDWSAATNSPTWAGSGTLNVYRSFALNAAMNITYSGAIQFNDTAFNQTIQTFNKTLISPIYFFGSGSLKLLDNLKTTNTVQFYNGKFSTNGFTMDVADFNLPTFNVNDTVDISNSLIKISGTWGFGSSNAPTFTFISTNSTIEINSGFGMNFYGGFKNYGKIKFTGTAASATFLLNAMGNADEIISNGTLSFDTINSVSKVQLLGNGNFNRSARIDTLILSSGKAYNFAPGKTYTLKSVQAIGSCLALINIQSSVSGSPAFWSASSGTITVDYAQLQDINGVGGATFNATHSVNLNNTTGWNFLLSSPINYYWVGGSGSWTDLSHWSLTSGGPGGVSCLPTANDSVFFNQNSFTGSNQQVTANSSVVVGSIDWTGANFQPTFLLSNPIKIYGSLKLIPSMTVSGFGTITFASRFPGNTITTANKNLLPDVYFDGTGSWTLLDSLKIPGFGRVFLSQGSLNVNGQVINADYFYSLTSNLRNLNITNSTLNLVSGFYISDSTRLVTNSAGSTINLTSTNSFVTCTFNGALQAYNNINSKTNVNFSAAKSANKIKSEGIFYYYNYTGVKPFSVSRLELVKAGYLYYGLNIDSLILTPGNNYEFYPGTTDTLKYVYANGSCTQRIGIRSGSASPFNWKVLSGSVNIDNVILNNCIASGGATFNATNVLDLGGNTGWNLSTPLPLKLYWVGGSGSWKDAAHWSFTSGGVGGACVPTLLDSAVFDASSFTTPGLVVSVDSIAECGTMIWTGVLNNPTFAGTFKFNVYGSLVLSSNMTVSYSGQIYFQSSSLNRIIDTKGKLMDARIYFQGTGGWNLASTLAAYSLDFYSGTFVTNGNDVSANTIYGYANSIDSLKMNFENSTINVVYDWYIYEFSPKTTLSMTNSTLNFTNTSAFSNSSFDSFNGVFNNVNFAGPGYLYNVRSIKSLYCASTMTLSDTTSIKRMELGSDANFYYGNIIDTLVLSPGGEYTFYPSTITKVNSVQVNGNCNQYITIRGSGGSPTWSKTTGTVNLSYVEMTGMTASGGATFSISNGHDMGGNSGWNFAPVTPQSFYWVGGTGNWDDASHWSNTSGGPSGSCVPSLSDDVFFDANSFTTPGQTVSIVAISSVRNIDWTGVGFNPVFRINNYLYVYGSLKLSPAMSTLGSSTMIFTGSATTNLITTNNVTLSCNLNFDGVGEWTLADNLSLNTSYGTISVNKGTFSSAGMEIKCYSFQSTTGSPKVINLSSSKLNIYNTFYLDVPSVLTINATNSQVHFTSINNFVSSNFYGANKAFGEIIFENRGSVNNLGSAKSILSKGIIDINVNSSGVISNISKLQTLGDANIYSTNVIDTFIIAMGKTTLLEANRTQTIKSLSTSGNCGLNAILKSRIPTIQTILSCASGTVSANFLQLMDVKAQGGATFIANNSVDLGNNTGWAFNSIATGNDRYWVGGSGNWNDQSHWSFTSGGAPGACLPNYFNNVYFDANSFPLSGGIVIVDATAFCESMYWNNVTNSPTFAGAGRIDVYGQMFLSSNMSVTHHGELHFLSTLTNQTIDMKGKVFGGNIFLENTGSWSMVSPMSTTGTLFYSKGTLTTNNYNLSIGSLEVTGTSAKTLNLGSSLFEVNGNWTTNSSTNFNFNVGTSTVKFNSNATLSINRTVFNELNFINTGIINGQIIVNKITANGLVTFNTFGSVDTIQIMDLLGGAAFNTPIRSSLISMYGGQTYAFSSFSFNWIDSIHSITSPVNCQGFFRLQGGSNTFFQKTNGTFSVTNANVVGIIAAGGASYYAFNSFDLGGNSGWSFTAPTGNSTTLYWVGGSGNWSDQSHWSLTSGGIGGACLPGGGDNVVFDFNSFSASGQSVNVDNVATCKNMTWQGVTNFPVLTGYYELNIYGSLTFDPNMMVNFFSYIFFRGSATNNTIDPAGLIFNNDFIFNGTGHWSLVGPLYTQNTLNLYQGSLNTNGNYVSCAYFSSDSYESRSLQLGNSLFVVANSWSMNNDSNLTFNAQTSTIQITSQFGQFYSGYQNYNRVEFVSPSAFFSSCQVFSNSNFKFLRFASGGYVGGNIVADSLISGGNLIVNGNPYAPEVRRTRIGFIDVVGTLSLYSLPDSSAICGRINCHYEGYFYGSNQIDTLSVSPNFAYYFESGITQQIKTIQYLSITCPSGAKLYSTTSGSQATISSSAGVIDLIGIRLRDVAATGGATFIARNAVNEGNVTGWTFISNQGVGHYWVGGTGLWSDPTHWSATSGGTGGLCPPQFNEDAIFDSNSFTGISRDVTIDVAATCKNMDWSAATNNPNLLGNNIELSIYGSLLLSPNMTIYRTGRTNFSSDSTGNVIFTNGKVLGGAIYFNGNGSWDLGDRLISEGIIFEKGHLKTNSNELQLNYFYSNTTTPRSIDFGGSTMKLISTFDIGNSTNLTLDADSLELIYEPFFSHTFNSGTQAYRFHNIMLSGYSGYCMINSADTFDIISIAVGELSVINDPILNNGRAFVADEVTVSNGNGYLYGVIQMDKIDINGVGQVNMLGGEVDRLKITGNAVIDGCFIHDFSLYSNTNIQHNNIIDTIRIFNPVYILVSNGTTQTINQIEYEGDCNSLAIFNTPIAGAHASFQKSSGTLSASHIFLADIHAIGGATFNAYNSVDFGNNTGWNFLASALDVESSPTCGNQNSGTASVVNINCNDVYSYSWSNGATTQSISNLASGVYSVVVVDSQGNTTTLVVTVPESCNHAAFVEVHAYLQGYYASSGIQNSALYPPLNFFYSDSLTIELHEGLAPFALVASQRALMNFNGIAGVQFSSVNPDSLYYIVVKHRNSIETWSSVPISLPSNLSYDFSSSSSSAFGGNMIATGDGHFALYSGDVNQDGVIDLTDLAIIESTQLVNYYPVGDLNADNLVETADYSLIENNAALGITVQRP